MWLLSASCDCSERRRKEKEAEAEEEEEDLRIRPSSPSGNKKKKRQRWNSIYVMYFTMFLSAISEWVSPPMCTWPRHSFIVVHTHKVLSSFVNKL